ncbi:MAG: hypothetical protein ABI744_06870 [Chloroflexota bacterium]
MRKRFGLFWALVVLAIALALPATTAAAGGYTYKTVYNYCYGNQVNLKMKDMAAGYTPANRLTIDSWAQRKVFNGWQTVYTWNQAYYGFYHNSRSHTLTAYRSYNGNSSYYFRIVFRLRAWNGNHVLASSTFHSVKC